MAENSIKKNDSTFKPLRKKLKHTETENNDVVSIFKDTFMGKTLSEEEIDELRWFNGIEVRGTGYPAPITSFADLLVNSKVIEYLRKKNTVRPTPIQMQSLSCTLSGRDIIGLAETGSGKTLAYLLPLVILLKKTPPRRQGQSPKGLIVAPTRELMQQIYEQIHDLLEFVVFDQSRFSHSSTSQSILDYDGSVSRDHQRYPCRAAAVCGGLSIQPQVKQIESGVDVLVATPGRLIDLCDRSTLCRSEVSYFVIDEVDRMLGMGLEEQLRKIVALATINQQPCQRLLFSATLPESLERLARSAVINTIEIQVGAVHVTVPNISHRVVFLHSYERPLTILQVLRETQRPPVIVFTSTKQNVDFIVNHLTKEQFHVAGLHSGKKQEYRFKLTTAFKTGKVDVLVASDLASRGLDIPEVTHVINYNMPDIIEEYIHRYGRTGRMARHGLATSFLTLRCKIAAELKDLLQSLEQPIPKELEYIKQFGKNVVETEFGDRAVHGPIWNC